MGDELPQREPAATTPPAPGDLQILEPFPSSGALSEARGRRASRLLRASFSVLRQDPELLVFPAVAIVDLSWTLATMFAVPVLAYENLGPTEVLRRSSRIFRQRWGTQIGGLVGISVASVFLYIPFVGLLLIGMASSGVTGVLLTVLGGGGLFAAIALQTAMDQVFRVFVYRSAVGLDTSGGPFSATDLQAPFARRRGRLF